MTQKRTRRAVGDKLSEAFGIEPEPVGRILPLPQGPRPAFKTVGSPKWRLPAWQVQKHTQRPAPEGWETVQNLSDVHEGAVGVFGSPAFIRYRECQERRLREGVRKSLEQLLRRYFEKVPMPFHLEILERLFQGGKHVINIPTDHGKSWLGTVAFPILSLMEEPEHSHIICCANLRDAERAVDAIQRELTTNAELIRDYPWIARPDKPLGRLWGKRQFNVVGRTHNDRNPSLAAIGLSANDIRGRRGKLLLDDIEGRDASSPVRRAELYDFVMLEAIRCFEDASVVDRPLLALLGTPYDVDSIYFKMESREFEVVRYPYINQYGHYLWPQRQQKIQDFRRLMSKREFSIAFRMDPTGGDDSVLSYEQIQQMSQTAQVQPDAQQSYTLVSLDPASGSQNKRADYAGVSVVNLLWMREEPLPQVTVQEAHRFTQGAIEQVHLARHLAQVYHCPILFEANSQQGGTYGSLFQHLGREDSPPIKIIRHYTTEGNKFDKHMGLTVLKTLLTQGRLTLLGEDDNEGKRALIEEIRDLGTYLRGHDHIASSVWFVIRWAYEQNRYQRIPHWTPTYQPRVGAHGYRGSPYYGGRPAAGMYNRKVYPG